MSKSRCSSVSVMIMLLAGRQETLGTIPGAVDIPVFTTLPRPGPEPARIPTPFIPFLSFNLVCGFERRGRLGCGSSEDAY